MSQSMHVQHDLPGSRDVPALSTLPELADWSIDAVFISFLTRPQEGR